MTHTLYRRQNRRERAEKRQQNRVDSSSMTGGRPVALSSASGNQVGPQSSHSPHVMQKQTSGAALPKPDASTSGSMPRSKTEGSLADSFVALSYLHGNVSQLQAGAELSQAQLRAMFDRMCELSAEVDELKGQLKSKEG